MSNQNYFSTRIPISELASDVGLSPTTSTIQRVGSLFAKLVDKNTYPSINNTYVPTTKGTLAMTYDYTNALSGTVKLEDPSNATATAGISLPPVGTLGYFPVDKVPEGWMIIGDPSQTFKHKTTIGYIGGNPLNPIYANTEYTEIYDILKSWDLIESESKKNYGADFNTKDPFRGYFLRCLNPDATGVDAGSYTLQTQNSYMSKHTHDGYNFHTYVEPFSVYNANGTFATAPTYYNFSIHYSEKRTSNTTPLAHDINFATGSFSTALQTMNYRDSLRIQNYFSGINSSAEPFTLAVMNYDGVLEPINSRELVYSISTYSGGVWNKTSYSGGYGQYKSAFITQRTAGNPWIPEVLFKPKKLLTADIYLVADPQLYTTNYIEKFKLYSYENSPIIDKGRIPFHDELLEDSLATREMPTVGPPSIPFSVGTQYYYNYKWMFSQTWNVLGNGTEQITYDNWNKAPFHFTDGDGVTHSVTSWDNHIHTRVETYYRSIYNTLYGRVASPQYPSIPTNQPSDYWFSGGPNSHIVPNVNGNNSISPPSTNPGWTMTPSGYVSTGKHADDFSSSQLAKGWSTTSPHGDPFTGSSAYKSQNAQNDPSSPMTPGAVTTPYTENSPAAWIDELNLTYETPYWLRSYSDFITTWDRGGEEYVKYTDVGHGVKPSGGGTYESPVDSSKWPNYTVRSNITTKHYYEHRWGHSPQYSPYRHHRWYQDNVGTTYTYYTEQKTFYSTSGGSAGAHTVSYLHPAGSSDEYIQYLRRTYRTRKLGLRRTFALRRYLTNAEAAVHILKSNPGTPVGTEYYNTGDDGNFAFRTTFEGNHHHTHVHDDSFYRGEDQFRPINIALKLCIKY